MPDPHVVVPPGPREFRRVVGRFATGVAVVTTVADGVPHAITVNSFTSVSLEPLLVLVCIERNARLHDALLAAGTWGVSVLAAGDEETSTWFATRGRRLDGQLDDHPTGPGPVTGVPLLQRALARLECRTWAVHPGGDHTVVVGEVLSAEAVPGDPLLYVDGGYRTPAP